MGLVHIFSSSSISRLLNFLRVHKFFDYSLKEMEEATGLSYRTLQEIVPMLVKNGIVRYTRTVGKAKLYIYNKDSEIAKQLDEFARKVDAEFLKPERMKVKIAQ